MRSAERFRAIYQVRTGKRRLSRDKPFWRRRGLRGTTIHVGAPLHALTTTRAPTAPLPS
eukprot:COSAG02_NODE_5198_length_4548_cov_1.989885_2_plen_59_part_00